MLVRYFDITGEVGSVEATIKSRTGTLVAGPVTLTQVEENAYELDVPELDPDTDYRLTINSLPEYTAIGTSMELVPVYAGLHDASLYFTSRLHGDIWPDLSDEDKVKHLIHGTREIDTLAFRHDRYATGQQLEFPRGSYKAIPPEIKTAAMELALSFADGQTLERKVDSLRVTSRRFANVATTYSSDAAPPNIEAGIISITAWKLLQPFLRQVGGVRIYRVS